MYLLVGVLIAVVLAIVLALCLTFVGGQPRASYSELKAAIHTVADNYGGTVHDRGSIDGLGVEFEIEGLRMFAGTFVSHRRKYINYHAFEIRTLPSDGSKPRRQVLSLAEAQSAEFFYQQSPPSLPNHDSKGRTPKMHRSRRMKYEENEVLRIVF